MVIEKTEKCIRTMESKCSMYMWDEFSDHRKACGNAMYIYMYMYLHKTSSHFIFGNNFLLTFVTHKLITVFFHQYY